MYSTSISEHMLGGVEYGTVEWEWGVLLSGLRLRPSLFGVSDVKRNGRE